MTVLFLWCQYKLFNRHQSAPNRHPKMHLYISRLFGLVLIVSIVLIENQTPGAIL